MYCPIFSCQSKSNSSATVSTHHHDKARKRAPRSRRAALRSTRRDRRFALFFCGAFQKRRFVVSFSLFFFFDTHLTSPFPLPPPSTAHCTGIGPVIQSEVARQPGGRSKGWGLVDYGTPAEAEAAIAQLHNSELQGRSIIVRLERAGGANKTGGVNAGRPEASSGLQIVVRNLPWSTTSEDLRQVFQQVGNVVKADSVCHADTGRSKGWGTVLFETTEQAQAAIQGFNGVELEHRPMQIKLDRYD